MARQVRARNATLPGMRLGFVTLMLVGTVGRAGAQSTETPVPFDSAQRVLAVTPALANRLKLTAPIWPVRGDFREARLYSVQPAGGFVLVVQRPTGSVERFALTDAERTSLRAAIDAAFVATGTAVSAAAGAQTPNSDVISEPAGNAFVRRQTLLAAFVYAPIASSLVDDGAGQGALYLAATGATFFATYSMAQSHTITRAQNHLAGSLGLSGAITGYLVGYSATGDADRGVRALALGSAIVGTGMGLSLGRNLSDAEAHGATAGSQAVALLSLATAGAAGAEDRGLAAVAAAGLLAGYPAGLAYQRGARYNITAGDADAVGTAGLIGALVGGALVGNNVDPHVASATLGATYLAGLFVGDRAIARQYDLTQSESNLAGVGAVAGALVGLALPVLARSDEPRFIFGATAAGAALGMAAVVSASKNYVGGRAAPSRSSETRGGQRRFGVEFTPTALLGAVGRVPGRYSVLHIGF